MITVLCIAASLTALSLTYILSEKYSATVLVLIRVTNEESVLEKVRGFKETGGYPITHTTPDTLNATYSEIIKSWAVAERIVESIGYENLQEKPPANVLKRILKSIKTSAKTLVIKTWDILRYGRLEEEDPVQSAIAKVQRGLSAETIKNTYLLRIRARTNNPEISALIANLAAEVFIEYSKQAGGVEATAEEAFIDERLNITKDELTQTREAMEEFKRQEGITLLDVQATSLLKAMHDVKARLKDTGAVIQTLQREREEIEIQIKKIEQNQKSTVTVTKNPVLMGLRTKLADMEISRSELLAEYMPEHPKVRSIETMIQETKKKISEENERIIGSEVSQINPVYQSLIQKRTLIDTRIPSLGAKEAALEGILLEYEDELAKIPDKDKEMSRFELNTQIEQAAYSHLSLLHEDARIKAAKALSDIRVVHEAIPPTYPEGPIKVYYVGIAFIMSVIVGVGLAFFLEYTNQSMQSVEEVEDATGLPVLGTLPTVAASWSELSVWFEQEST